jgi:hypothetical protein
LQNRADSRIIVANRNQPMMRSRAIAIAEQQARETRLMLVAGLLLLPLLLLLLISP